MAERQGPLYDAARALRRAALRLEDFAEVDDHTTVDNCDSQMRKAAQLSRLNRAEAEINAALARMAAYR